MFGGLEVKGGKEESTDPSVAAAPAPSSSSFSFMQSSRGGGAGASSATETPSAADTSTEPTASNADEAASGMSAFSFLSSTIGATTTSYADAPIANGTDAPVPAPTAQESSAPSMFDGLKTTSAVPSSGFSFMSSPTPMEPSAAPPAEAANDNVEGVSTVSTAGSSFGFLSSTVSTSSATSNATSGMDDTEKGESAATGGGESGGGGLGGMSGFSFLSAPAAPATPAPATKEQLLSESATDNNNASPATAVSSSNSDLLSLSNPGLPAGAGVSWSAPPVGVGIAKKKVIKKRVGKTRVGVGAASPSGTNLEMSPQPQSNADPYSNINGATESQFEPPPPPPLQPTTSTMSMDKPPPGSPPMREKAERANQNAEQFLKEKQRSAIAMAAERAMQDRSSQSGDVSVASSEGGISTASSSGWKMSNTVNTPASPKDETYQAAKAAAEEARKMAESSPATTKGKVSLFSGFFGRGKGTSTPGSSSAGEAMSSYSSHGGVVGRVGSSGSITGGVGSDAVTMPSLSPTAEESNGSERVSVDNEEAKRAMAERALQDDRARELALARETQRLEIERQQRQADHERRLEEEARLEQERIQQIEEEAAAKRRSPREKMQAILDHFADVTRTSTDRVTQLREKRVKLTKDKLNAEKAQRYSAQQISYAEAQQTKAAEEEDFESADRLASVIERHTVEKDEQSNIVKVIVATIEELDREREVASKAVAGCFSEVCSKLKDLQNEQEARRKEDGTDVSVKISRNVT